MGRSPPQRWGKDGVQGLLARFFRDINSLEARALLHSLLAFRDHIRDTRVDVHTDSRTLKAALEDFACKSSTVSESVMEILQCGRQ